MKIFLVVTACWASLALFVIDDQTLMLGLAIIAAAALIAAAIVPPPPRPSHYAAYAGEVYQILSAAPLPMKELLNRLTKSSHSESFRDLATAVLVSMLDEGKLVVINGKISLPQPPIPPMSL